MPNAVPKEDYPDLNKRERRRIMRDMKRRIDPTHVERGGWERFLDQSNFDVYAVRRVGMRTFGETADFGTAEEADRAIEWLMGERDDMPEPLHASDRARMEAWRAQWPTSAHDRMNGKTSEGGEAREA